jgi:aquaporin Z
MAYVIGGISGCHINPAVSLAMFIAGKLPTTDLIGYVAAQFAGGLAGAAILAFFISSSADLTVVASGMGVNGFGAGYGIGISMIAAIVVEVVLTFVFIFTILGVTSDSSNSSVAGLVIGLTLVFVHILGINLTGTSVNPARSLAPALFVGGKALSQVWVFIVAPLIGSAIAACAWKFLKEK